MPHDEPLPPPLPQERLTRPDREASLAPLSIVLLVLAVLLAAGVGFLARGWLTNSPPDPVALKPAPRPKTTMKAQPPRVEGKRAERQRSTEEPDPAADLIPAGEPPTKAPTKAAPPEAPNAAEPLQETPPELVLAPTASSADPPPSQPAATLYQELDIQRLSKLGMLGTITVQDLRYRILSQLRSVGPDAEGQLAVDQVVLETRLVKSDELSGAMFEASLAELRGWQFSYKLSSRREVTDWKASPPDGRKVAAVTPKGGTGFLVTSVMDEDGWRELAQLSFFQPQPTSGGGKSWRRPMQHNFGPLGHWYGETQFTPQAKRSGTQQIAFVHKLEYRPPEKDLGELPFTIEKATLRPETAGGTIHYDHQVDRVQSAQETFLVRGSLDVSLLGQSATVEVEEQQLTTLRLHEQNPWEK